MRILLLGGTGAMGNHLVDLLNTYENEVYVTSRLSREPYGNVHFILGNAKENTFLTKLLDRNWDVIIDFMIYNTGEFSERINLLLSSTSQYIFLSSSTVYAGSTEPIKETSPRLLDVSTDETFLTTDVYPLSKARQENILIKSDKKNWTIIRPYITYSSQRLQLGIFEKEDWLFRALSGRTIVFSKDINRKVTTMTYGLDVAKGIVAIIGKSRALGEIFHITSNKSYNWSDILEVYLNVLEKHLEYRPNILFDDIDNFYKYKNSLYSIKYDRLFDRTFDNTKIGEYLDVNSFTKAEEGIEENLNKFLRNPKFNYYDVRSDALMDRRTKETANLRLISGYKQKVKYLLYRFFQQIK